MFEFVTDILDEWSGEDADELIELIETQLSELGLELKVDAKDDEEDAEEEDDEEEETDDEDVDVGEEEEVDFADDEE
jgi:hypothetical protein